MKNFFRTYTLYMAWVLTLLGILISFFFSDILNLEPCHLCWFQRICLFPLAIILGLASYRGFHGISFYLLPLVALGFLLSAYQVMIQEIPGFHPLDICGRGPNCLTKHFIGIGAITIPMLATFSFLILTILLSISLCFSKKGEY